MTADRMKVRIDDWPMERDAVISDCQKFRYQLTRIWDRTRPKLMIVGLNCSTADTRKNDPTVRREILFAMDMKFGSLYKANLFAFRTPNPKEMKAALDPVGPENNSWIARMAAEADKVVVAWGTHGSFGGRDRAVEEILKMIGKPLWCFGITKNGFPKHPLYLPSETRLVAWNGIAPKT